MIHVALFGVFSSFQKERERLGRENTSNWHLWPLRGVAGGCVKLRDFSHLKVPSLPGLSLSRSFPASCRSFVARNLTDRCKGHHRKLPSATSEGRGVRNSLKVGCHMMNDDASDLKGQGKLTDSYSIKVEKRLRVCLLRALRTAAGGAFSAREASLRGGKQ